MPLPLISKGIVQRSGQARCLYIYDPKVLHHILASDQTLVDEPAFISEYVCQIYFTLPVGRRITGIYRSYRLVHGPCLMSATGALYCRSVEIFLQLTLSVYAQAMNIADSESY